MAFHIFTVTEDTFKIHLKYKFAWTWFNPILTESQNESDFDWSHTWVAEDISCCKVWDMIIFYVMWVWFFWFFEVTSTPFFDNWWNTYIDELKQKKLPYRLLFKVSKEYWLFLKPSLEWDTTDDLSLFKNPKVSDIQWNWLYKKLSWNRWCLHIFDWEWKNICKILEHFNQWEKIIRNVWLDYDKENKCIITIKNTNQYEWDINNNIEIKIESDYYVDSEHSLEFYIIKNRVKDIIWNNNKFLWCQTFASLWKRAIDILSISENNEWRIIELKKSNITPKLIKDTLYQINKYIKWAKSRYREDINLIIPILVFWPWVKKEKSNWDVTSNYNSILSFISDFNHNSNVEKIKIFEYELTSDNKLKFNEFKYD